MSPNRRPQAAWINAGTFILQRFDTRVPPAMLAVLTLLLGLLGTHEAAAAVRGRQTRNEAGAPAPGPGSPASPRPPSSPGAPASPGSGGNPGLTEARIFRTLTPVVDAPYVSELGAAVFALTGATTEEETQVTLADETRTLVVQRESGAFRYADNAKLWNPAYAGPAGTREQAILFADTFLRTHGLMPPNETMVAADLMYARHDDGARSPNFWQVTYNFTVDASTVAPPVLVPVYGTKVSVMVGLDEVIGLYWNYRTLEPVATVRLYDDTEIRALLAADEIFRELTPEPQLIYFVEAAPVRQAYVAPAFLVLAAEDDHAEALVPGSDFSPRVRITSDLVGLADDLPVTLVAEVSAGTPPYTYRWLEPVTAASSDPLLGDQNPSVVSLTAGNHKIWVEITDASGMIATARQGFPVAPSGGGPLRAPLPGSRARTASRAVSASAAASAPVAISHLDWSMQAIITAHDGLRLRNVTYDSHLLAEEMSLPFYRVDTSATGNQACELENPPPGPVKPCYTYSVGELRVYDYTHALVVEVGYEVRGFGSAESTLQVYQVYVFEAKRKAVAPGDKAYIAPYHPLIAYSFCSNICCITGCDVTEREASAVAGTASLTETLQSIEFDQRFDFRITPIEDPPSPELDEATLVQDVDTCPISPAILCLIDLSVPALPFETTANMASFGAVPGAFDNYHQKETGLLPVVIPGCTGTPLSGNLGCNHMHWRWSAILKDTALWGNHGAGSVLVPDSQRADVYVVADHIGEVDPPAFDLANLMTIPEPLGPAGQDIVLWQKTTCQGEGDWVNWMTQFFFR